MIPPSPHLLAVFSTREIQLWEQGSEYYTLPLKRIWAEPAAKLSHRDISFWFFADSSLK